MKLIIEEHLHKDEILGKDSYWNKPSTPLTYRISIKLNETEVLLKREYFFVGYLSGEQPDVFYFNDEGWDKNYLTYATFITRTFDDKYLKEKETELIEKFLEKLDRTRKKIIKDKSEKIEYFDKKIKEYQEYNNCELFLKLKRKLKIKEIEK